MTHVADKVWIQSYTGKKITPLNLQPDQVCLEDIAHALANKGRYTGHAKYFYSVAQHCVLGARAMPLAFRLPFLLHELSEVYLPDIAGPLKPYVCLRYTEDEGMSWETIEKEHTHVMLGALGLSAIESLIYSEQVRTMDLRMLVTEAKELHVTPPQPWGLEEKYPVLPTVSIEHWQNHSAEREFLHLFEELTK